MELIDLVKIAESENIDIVNWSFKGNLKGLYCDNCIAISDKVETKTEQKCILAEELGHHFTNIGNITDPNDLHQSQQEHRGRRWGIDKLVKLENIISARKEGIRNMYELAQYLDVTENYLYESLQVYKSRYGKNVRVGDVILDLDTLQAVQVLAEGEASTNRYINKHIEKSKIE